MARHGGVIGWRERAERQLRAFRGGGAVRTLVVQHQRVPLRAGGGKQFRRQKISVHHRGVVWCARMARAGGR